MKKLLTISVLSLSLATFGCTNNQQTNTDLMNIGQSLLGSGLFQNTAASALSTSEIGAGLREALTVGTGIVVAQLGKTGGFSADSKIKIPLPAELQKVDDTLNLIGMGALSNDLKTRMNAAAEMATPKAKELFIGAIQKMTIADAKAILTGPNDAATTYLRQAMGSELAQSISPLVQNAMQQAGAVQAYDAMMGQYAALPFMPNIKANLNDYVVNKTMDGIFYYVAKEEAAIRTNPAKRTTELLKKVFGG
jgi:hypothetical protein